MPFYDRRCPVCETTQIDEFEPVEAPKVPCGQCGEPTERAWLSKPANVIGDELWHLQVNGVNQPTQVYSKSERKRLLKANGWREKDDYAPVQGSDKDKFGSVRWAAIAPETLAGAKAMLERNSSSSGWRDPNKAPIGITSEEGLIRYMGDKRKAEQRGEFGFSER